MIADVVCRSCGDKYHETTEKYDPNTPTRATMLKLKEPWAGYGWEDFPQDDSVGYDSLACPGCGVPYCNSAGFVKTVDPPVTSELMDKLMKDYEVETPEVMPVKVVVEPVKVDSAGFVRTVNPPVTSELMDKLMGEYEVETPAIEPAKVVVESTKADVPGFVCAVCGKPYKSKSTLKRHMATKHPVEA